MACRAIVWCVCVLLLVGVGRVQAQYECPGQCQADRDNNATVDGADLGTLLGAWNTNSLCDDLDGSGNVDGGDLAILLAAWGQCPVFGACCLPDMLCMETTVYDCQTVRGGVFLGSGSQCLEPVCTEAVEPLGACCIYENGWCIQLSEAACAAIGGDFAGAGVECSETACCECHGAPESCASVDCNGNGIVDTCEIAAGTATDCNENGVPDTCEDDCDGDGIAEVCVPFQDCNGNEIHDPCEGPESDLDGNHIPDECDIAAGRLVDCDNNLIPDDFDRELPDCNANQVPDSCDIASGASTDCDGNGIPDECEAHTDCNGNGIPDACDFAAVDCNANGIPDSCELVRGDLNRNGILDECEFECAPDLDIDSDNSGTIDGTSREDLIESRNPGRLLLASTDAGPAPLVPLALTAGCTGPALAVWSLAYPEESLAIYHDALGTMPLLSGTESAVPAPSFVWVRGLVSSESQYGSEGVEIVLTVREVPALRAPAKQAKDVVKVKVVAPAVTALTFEGVQLWTYTNDHTDKAVPRPQWSAATDVTQPFVLVREGGAVNPAPNRSITASFKAGEKFTGALKVKATSNHGVTVDEKTLEFKNGIAINQRLTMSNVPDTVNSFEDFELTWTFEVAGDGVFASPQKTKNALYIVNGRPIAALSTKSTPLDRFYVDYLSSTCSWASGKQEVIPVFNEIWGKLKTRTATHLGYYCPVVPEWVKQSNALDLIADRNGRCGQWAVLLLRLTEAHGIDLSLLGVASDFKSPIDGVPTKFPTIAVKEFRIANRNLDVWEGNHESLKGLPGQTPPETDPALPADPPCPTPHLKIFGDHAAVIVQDGQGPATWRIFDPSYGVDYGPDTLDNVLKKLDDASIAYFIGPTKLVKNGNVFVKNSPWRANPDGKDITHKISPR